MIEHITAKSAPPYFVTFVNFEFVCLSYKAQKDAGECHIKIPIITFDSPEKEKQEGKEREEAADSEDDPALKQQQTGSHSEEFHLCRETTASESTTLEGPDPDQEHLGVQIADDSTHSPQLTNDNSSSGIDVHSHHDDTDPLDPNVDLQGFLRLPPASGRYGPGGRAHIRGLSMDSGKDAVLLPDRSHITVRRQLISFSLSRYLHPPVHSYTRTCVSSSVHDHFQVGPGGEGRPGSQRIQLLGVCFLAGVSQYQRRRSQHKGRREARTQRGSGSCR